MRKLEFIGFVICCLAAIVFFVSFGIDMSSQQHPHLPGQESDLPMLAGPLFVVGLFGLCVFIAGRFQN
jgi:hypothetical protein